MCKKKRILHKSLRVAIGLALLTSFAMPASAAIMSKEVSQAIMDSSKDISISVASEGMVLMENNKITSGSQKGQKALPLRGKDVALFGTGTWATIRGGTGSGATYLDNIGQVKTVFRGFDEAGYNIANRDWVSEKQAYYDKLKAASVTVAVKLMDTSTVHEEAYTDAEKAALLKTVEGYYNSKSGRYDIPAVYTINRNSGEGIDRRLTAGDYYLSEAEEANLAWLGKNFSNVIVVLNVGGIIDTKFFNGDANQVYYKDFEGVSFNEKIGETKTPYYTKTTNGDFQLASAYNTDVTYYQGTPCGNDFSKAAAEAAIKEGLLYKATENGKYALNVVMTEMGYFMATTSIKAIKADKVTELPADFTDCYIFTKQDNAKFEFENKVLSGEIYTDKNGTKLNVVNSFNAANKYYTQSTGIINGLTALVDMSQGGTQSGTALVNALSGKTNFSGKMVDTWAKNFSDYPASDHFSWLDNDVIEENYQDDIYVGYRYFDTYDVTPAYPFGYGLSYTDFKINVTSIEADKDVVTVKAKVKNTGKTSGKEVVQVYFSAPKNGKLDVPFQELAGYAKTNEIKAGGSEEVIIVFPTEELSSYDEANAQYIIEKGDYIIRVGDSSRDTVAAATVTFPETIVTEQCQNLFGLTKKNMEEGSYDPSITMSSKAYKIDMLHGSKDKNGTGLKASDIDVKKRMTTSAQNIVFSDKIETRTHQYTNGKRVAYVNENSSYKAKANETLEKVAVCGKNGKSLIDVYRGRITMNQFLADLSVDELIDIVQGGSDETMAVSTENSDIIGYQAAEPYGGTGGTTKNLYNSRFIPNTETADGGAGVRVHPTYELYEAIPMNALYDSSTKYYTAVDNPYGGDTYNPITFSSEAEFKAKLSESRLYVDKGAAYQYAQATPIATAIAQTWNTALAEEEGRAIGNECANYDITYWLAPAMNIHRNPLCGRNFEYYSEDPVIAGLQAGAINKGVVTKADGTPSGISTMIKHYALNNQENNRMGSNSMASERAIREIYLKAFEKIVETPYQPLSIMSSYNQVNGIPAYENYNLLTEVPESEWGFDGFMCSDWYSFYGSMCCGPDKTSVVKPGTGAFAYDSGSKYAAYDFHIHAGQIEAGLGLQMPGSAEADVKKAWDAGLIRLASLQHCAGNVLKATMKSAKFLELVEKVEANGLNRNS